MSFGTLYLFSSTLNTSPQNDLYAKTVAFSTLALFQIMNVQNCRSLDQGILFSFKHRQNRMPRLKFSANLPLFATMGLALIFQVAASQFKPLQPFLQTTEISLSSWGQILIFTSSIILLSEALKYGLFIFQSLRRR